MAEGSSGAANELLRLPAGIQVKARAMPSPKIITEMQPHGALRPSIQALLEAGGVYVIASGKEDLADRRRTQLIDTMRDQVPAQNRDQVALYDSRQLAAWCGKHPGVAAWLREQVGRPLDGWCAWGSWSAPDQPADLPYLLDEEARVCRPVTEPDRAYAVPTGLALVREALAAPRSVVRLTGLSGMGKTRFAQAVFDGRVGASALDPSLVIYGDAGFEKAASPGQLARSLVEDRVEAVLIVDNCPAERHRELTGIVRRLGSRLRLLTIDFDLGDDQPDHTEVFRLQNAGEDLIDSLLRQRAPELTRADRHRIVEFAGGNTRIALAIALAPRGRKGIAHLRNDELLDRLFLKGRRDPDVELRRVARAAALVNAFSVSGDEADEAHVLATLADVSDLVFHEKMAELLERGLAQKRGDQRSILPPAIAAWLAAEALSKLPAAFLTTAFDERFPARLQLSFARRLGLLQEVPEAAAIARRLLSPGGRFAAPKDDNGHDMRAVRFLAPLAPDLALDVAERMVVSGRGMEPWRPTRRELRQLLIALAYEAAQFDRAAELLATLAEGESDDQRNFESVRDKILPMFHIQRSGTHATPAQRFAMIDRWLASGTESRRSLGLAALNAALETRFAGADPQLDYGAERRDTGWHPHTHDVLRDWYREGLARARGLLDADATFEAGLTTIARHYPSLAAYPVVAPDAVAAMRAASGGAFWAHGWFAACDAVWRLRKKQRPRPVTALEREMRPTSLADEAEVWLRLDWQDWRNPEHADQARDDWPEARRRAVAAGVRAAEDDALVQRVLGDRTYEAGVLGEGLAEASAGDYRTGWERLRRLRAETPTDRPNWSVFSGYLLQFRSKAPALAETLLDEAIIDPLLKPFAVQLCVTQGRTDDRALDRILTLLRDPDIDSERRRGLWALRFDDGVSPDRTAELVDALVACGEIDQAVYLLWLRNKDTEWSPALRAAAAEAVARADIVRDVKSDGRGEWDRRLARVAERALVGVEGEAVAARLLDRVTALGDENSWIRRSLPERLTKSLFVAQPRLALNAFLPCLLDERRHALRSIIQEHDDDDRPARSVFNRIPEDILQGWLLEDPRTRGRLLAQYGSYFERGPDNAFQWTRLGQMLLDVADPETLEMVGDRFDLGMSSGGWSERYRRRRPMIEALQNHSNPDVRPWAEGLLAYIDEQIERRRDWDRRPPDRFE